MFRSIGGYKVNIGISELRPRLKTEGRIKVFQNESHQIAVRHKRSSGILARQDFLDDLNGTIHCLLARLSTFIS